MRTDGPPPPPSPSLNAQISPGQQPSGSDNKTMKNLSLLVIAAFGWITSPYSPYLFAMGLAVGLIAGDLGYNITSPYLPNLQNISIITAVAMGVLGALLIGYVPPLIYFSSVTAGFYIGAAFANEIRRAAPINSNAANAI